MTEKPTCEELEKRVNRLEALFANSQLATVELTDDIIDAINPEFTRIFGFEPKDAVGKQIDSLFTTQEYYEGAEKLTKKTIDGATVHKVTKRKRKDGSSIDVEIFAGPLKVKGTHMGSYGRYKDITEKKRLEEQLQQAQKMEAIGTLAGGIAHDFNNILGIILGNTELVIHDIPEWTPAGENLEEVRKACVRAKDVVRQILSFSHQTEVKRRPVHVGAITEEFLKLLRASIPTTIEIRKELACKLDTVLADTTQIHQLLPLVEAEAESEPEETGVLPKGNERVLFVDDEKSLVRIANKMLERLGYRVVTGTRPQDALETFRSRPNEFDLVLSDMTMPTFSGDKLAAELLKIRPDIPVILSTGFSDQIDEPKAVQLGIKAFIMKPLVMSDLAATIRKVLDEKDRMRTMRNSQESLPYPPTARRAGPHPSVPYGAEDRNRSSCLR